MRFKVTEVIDGDTIKVTPNWEWKGQSGDTVNNEKLIVFKELQISK